MNSPALPDVHGLAAYRLGRKLNEFYFCAIQAWLLNAQTCPQRTDAERAWAEAKALCENLATDDRGLLKRRIDDFCQEWLSYLDSEKCAEVWHGKVNEYQEDASYMSEQSWEAFCCDWTRNSEVEFENLLERIGSCLAEHHRHLIRIAVELDRGIRPLSVWRGMGEPWTLERPAKYPLDEPRKRKPFAKHCLPGSIEPDFGWRDQLNALFQNSPYERLARVRLPDGVPKVAVTLVDTEVQQALNLEMQPRWDGTSRKLFWGDVVVKDWKRVPARHQQKVVEAFQDAGWTRTIPDPLRDTDLLRRTVDNFNRSLKQQSFKLSISSSGDYVTWIQTEVADE